MSRVSKAAKGYLKSFELSEISEAEVVFAVEVPNEGNVNQLLPGFKVAVLENNSVCSHYFHLANDQLMVNGIGLAPMVPECNYHSEVTIIDRQQQEYVVEANGDFLGTANFLHHEPITIRSHALEPELIDYLYKLVCSRDFLFIEIDLVSKGHNDIGISEFLVDFLEDFYWHSNFNKSYNKCHGFFVNKKHYKVRFWLRDKLLRISLRHEIYLGIRYSFKGFLRKVFQKVMQGVHEILVNMLRVNESRLLALTITKIEFLRAKLFGLENFRSKTRQILSISQVTDPLRDRTPPVIDVAIPCHPKDYENLQLVIQGVRKSVSNPIGKIYLVTPRDYVIKLQDDFPECHVLSDDEVLNSELLRAIQDSCVGSRRSWILQQVIKFRIAMLSTEIATLVLDADTILIARRLWVDSRGRQVLCIGEDFYLPYKNHQRRVFGGENYLLAFVTHFQLMTKVTLSEIFSPNGHGLVDWIKLGDPDSGSAISEYDTYGEWLASNRPERVVFAKWNNSPKKIDPKVLRYEDLTYVYGKFGSISNHSYLE
jgi:hypothetical protein